jgi:hypothetical protein
LDAGYTANLVPYITHTLQMTLCELWSRSYTMHLQLRIFRLQYSAIGICAAIGDIPTFRRSLYHKHWAKYNGHPPVCAMRNMVRTGTMNLQLRIFRLQGSSQRICAAIGEISRIQ